MAGIYKCILCNHELEHPDFDEVEEELWGHIQMDHEDLFEEIQDLETPDMIANFYEWIPVVLSVKIGP